MPDRAQDTEAIRAAPYSVVRERAQKRLARFPSADPRDTALDAAIDAEREIDRLVARLEAAERHEKLLRRGLHGVMTAEPVEHSERLLIGACHWSPCAWCDARAALAAAAPGETEQTP